MNNQFQKEYWDWAISIFEVASTQQVIPVRLPNEMPLTIPNLVLWTVVDKRLTSEQIDLLTKDMTRAKVSIFDLYGAEVPMYLLLSQSHKARVKFITERILNND